MGRQDDVEKFPNCIRLKENLRQIFSHGSSRNSESWLESLALNRDGDTLRVYFPHEYFANWFLQHKRHIFENALKNFYQTEKISKIIYKHIKIDEIKFIDGNRRIDTDSEIIDNCIQQFDFISNDIKNNVLCTIINGILENKLGGFHNIILIFGKSGTGKTYILKNLEKLYTKKYRNAYQIIYKDALKFCNENINYFYPEFFWHNYNVLLLDDVQELSFHDLLQKNLIRCIDSCPIDHQIVISYTGKLDDLKTLNRSLQTRLECGLAVNLTDPDIDIRLKYIDIISKKYNVALNPNQRLNIAQRHVQFSALQGAILKMAILPASREDGDNRDASERIPEVRNNEKPSNCSRILEQVADLLRVRPEDILGNKRRTNFVRARQIAMYVCRRQLGISYPELARFFGGKDHSTVIYAVKKIENLLITDKYLQDLITRMNAMKF